MAQEKTQDRARDAGFAVEADTENTALARTAGAQMAGREMAEIQAAYVMAMRNPRNEGDCYGKIVRACERPTFAEGVRYVFPRGQTQVEGPSVKFARESARCWGNIQYGYRVTDATDERTTVEGWAVDLETNARVVASLTFKNLVQRKRSGQTVWILPDERDYRELVAKNGAVAERNAILKMLPPDVIEDALRVARETLVKAAKGEIKQDKPATIRRLVAAFRDVGVTGEMIEAKLAHALDLITEEELADLRGIFAALRDGQAKREDYFELPGHDGRGDTRDLKDLTARMQAQRGGVGVPVETTAGSGPAKDDRIPEFEEDSRPFDDPRPQGAAAPLAKPAATTRPESAAPTHKIEPERPWPDPPAAAKAKQSGFGRF